MKKIIIKKLFVFVITVWAFLLTVNSLFQYSESEKEQTASSLSILSQIEEVLSTNTESLETLTTSLQEEYIIKAKTAAYILEIEDITTEAEYQELANLLEVDEIHVFNEEGVIYEGSICEYYGYSFSSGAQMDFFSPLLEDKELTLCQDISPNTAESKYMMYIATWKSDGSDIVQIGIEPERILEEQSQNDLSYIFSNMIKDEDTNLYAIDIATGIITGCTQSAYVNVESSSLGLDIDSKNADGQKFITTINGVNKFCVFLEYEGMYIGCCTNNSVLQSEIMTDILYISLYFTLAAIILFYALFRIIDKNILINFSALTSQVSKITGGDLDTQVDINASPEFTILSENLNKLVSSLLHSTDKISQILDHTDSNIAIYEYKKDMDRVFYTSKLLELLDLDPDVDTKLLADKKLFEEKIQTIKNQPTSQANTYQVQSNKYLLIETFTNEDGDYGIISDVSDALMEHDKLKRERDYDLLTDLYNRRAIYRESKKLFNNPTIMKEAVVMILDGDNLKTFNDTYGHDIGDLVILKFAQILKNIPTDKKVVGRLGGDEFVVVLYGQDDKDILLKQIEDLRFIFDKETIFIEGVGDIPLHMSAGYIFTNDYALHFEECLKCADTALYISKNAGKNTFTAYFE